MEKLLARARRDRARRENRPSVYGLKGWRSVLYYLYYRNRYFFLRESGMWLFNLLEVALAAWFLGGMRVRGFALAGRYVQLLCLLWGGVALAERILVGRYQAAGKPERIARTVATFIQMGALAGLLLALALNLLAPVLVAPSAGEDRWTVLFFRHRALLLLPELISGSLFAGAYTLARMYRPLSITFLVRLGVVVSNVFLFPVWGEPVLVVNLYLPRLIDLAVTAWVARRWAFDRHRVPALPLRSLPRLNAGLLRELSPLVAGRCLGVLFAGGYGLLVLQAVSWILPGEMVFYVLFYQTLGLLYLLPKRLGRSVFFDITHLLVWNRLGVLRDYVRKLDRVSAAGGFATAGVCLLLAAFGDRLAWWPAERFAQIRPLLFAAAPFLFFHPQNAVWQSVRDAAGELRFNNLLLLATNYLVALPVSLWILLKVRGEMHIVQSHGLDFVVVTHTLLFVRVLLVDGAMEGVRAVLSRFHIFRFRWADDSPLRVTRSLMDTELALAQGHAVRLSFSQDLAELWGERFLRARDEGLVSLPYWGYTVARFLRNRALRARGYGLIRLMLDRRSRAAWKPGGDGFRQLLASIRPVDSACRPAHHHVAVFLPCITPEELRRRVADLSAALGIHLRDLAYAHSSTDALHAFPDVARWITSAEGPPPPASAAGQAFDIDHAWHAASRLFQLRRGEDEAGQAMLRRLGAAWSESEQRGSTPHNFASNAWANILRERAGAGVTWHHVDHWTAGDRDPVHGARFLSDVIRTLDVHRIPDFRRFLKSDASHLLPFFHRTNLVGLFEHDPLEHPAQMALVRVAAAFYLWSTFRSVETFAWEDEKGFSIAPVFDAALDAARRLEREAGVPYVHRVFRKPRRAEVLEGWLKEVRHTLGGEALLLDRRRRIEVLLPGMEPARAAVLAGP